MAPPILWTADVTVEFVASSREEAVEMLHKLTCMGGLIAFNAATVIQSQPSGGVEPGVCVIPVLEATRVEVGA
jgi:hypothetical protein